VLTVSTEKPWRRYISTTSSMPVSDENTVSTRPQGGEY
jgi:hypothetical protein